MIVILVVAVVGGTTIMKLNKNTANAAVSKIKKDPKEMSKLRSLIEH